MCPLVERDIVIENENTSYMKDTVKHTLYVPPAKMLPTDVEVEPVSDAQLAELAAQYPAEYGQKAKDLGIAPASEGRLAQLLDLSNKELGKAIAGMALETDEEILWSLYEAEISEDGEDGDGTGRKRPAILAALAQKGVEEK